MRTTVLVRFALVELSSLLAALAPAAYSTAATLEVSVVDEQGRPIEDVAVYATSTNGAAAAPAALAGSEPKAVMDQKDLQFVPHLLIVQSGTEVMFPNGDDVSHHVYSFSEAKPFELPLYKGNVYPPVVFDQPGVVVLGCNIHDGMLGYIVVVDTPHFAKTDEQGVALINDVPSGDYILAAWTPRARPAALPQSQQMKVGEGNVAAEIQVTGRLSPAHEHKVSSLTW